MKRNGDLSELLASLRQSSSEPLLGRDAYSSIRGRTLALHERVLQEAFPQVAREIEQYYPKPRQVGGYWHAPSGALITAEMAETLLSHRVSDVELFLARRLSAAQFARLLDQYGRERGQIGRAHV